MNLAQRSGLPIDASLFAQHVTQRGLTRAAAQDAIIAYQTRGVPDHLLPRAIRQVAGGGRDPREPAATPSEIRAIARRADLPESFVRRALHSRWTTTQAQDEAIRVLVARRRLYNRL